MTVSTGKPKVDFIGVGVNKSGTKWIYRCLSEHPQICFSKRKETHFFNRNYSFGMSWYSKQYEHCEATKMCGEFSPEYIDAKVTIERIYNDYPQAKILMIIREPLDRLRSSWEFDYRRGRHNYLNFEDYIKVIEHRLVEKNFYHSRIKLLLNYFPRQQIHIMLFDDIKNNPKKMLQNLYLFLGVNPDFEPSVINKKINSSQDSEVKIRLINNIIFTLRRIKESRFLRPFSPLISYLRIGKFATYIHKVNRSNNTKTENLNPTLTNETKKQFYQLFQNETDGLKQELGLDLPKNWTFQNL